MPRIRPTEDVRPLSEFRARAASFVQQVQGTGRPVILTQHGRSAAVLLDVRVYEDLLEQVELLRDIRAAEKETAEGRGISHRNARASVLKRPAR